MQIILSSKSKDNTLTHKDKDAVLTIKKIIETLTDQIYFIGRKRIIGEVNCPQCGIAHPLIMREDFISGIIALDLPNLCSKCSHPFSCLSNSVDSLKGTLLDNSLNRVMQINF